MSLSDKIVKVNDCRRCLNQELCFKEDVAEFIKKLKDTINNPANEVHCSVGHIHRIINRLAGDKLIDSPQKHFETKDERVETPEDDTSTSNEFDFSGGIDKEMVKDLLRVKNELCGNCGYAEIAHIRRDAMGLKPYKICRKFKPKDNDYRGGRSKEKDNCKGSPAREGKPSPKNPKDKGCKKTTWNKDIGRTILCGLISKGKIYLCKKCRKDEDKSLDIPYPAGHNWEGLTPRQIKFEEVKDE